MIKILKNGEGFLISEKDKKWSCEASSDSADFTTYSTEKGKSKSMIFNWPGEYEKNGIELRSYEISNNGLTVFVGRIDGKNILHIPSVLSELKEKAFEAIDETIDIIITNISEKTDINILKNIIDKIEAKMVIFSGDVKKIEEKIKDIQQEEEIKIGSLEEDKTLYFKV